MIQYTLGFILGFILGGFMSFLALLSFGDELNVLLKLIKTKIKIIITNSNKTTILGDINDDNK